MTVVVAKAGRPTVAVLTTVTDPHRYTTAAMKNQTPRP